MTLPVFDKLKSRRSFERAAHQYDQYARLQQQVAATLLSHFDERFEHLNPVSVLDLGCGTGQVTEAMCKRYAVSSVFALDFSQKMLAQTQKRLVNKELDSLGVCADAEQLPFQQESFDLIVSSLMLQWANDLEDTLVHLRDVLTPNGTLAFSSFSHGTLKELKSSWSDVDGAAHSSDFLSLAAFEAVAKAAGYSEVTILPETITICYDTIREMLQEMKGIGASNARSERVKGLTGRQRFEAFEAAFESHRLYDGRYPCTWEVTYVFCVK